MKLHPDWPEYAGEDRWDIDANPHAELSAAFDDYPSFATAEPVSQTASPIALADVAQIGAYYIASHGERWKPGDYIGTDLDMVLLGVLNDGRWFSLVGWNDYTGWGCQSGADIRIGGTRAEVIAYGLDNTERERLGL